MIQPSGRASFSLGGCAMTSIRFISRASLLVVCFLCAAARGQMPTTVPTVKEILLEDPRNAGAKRYLDLDTGRTFTYGETCGNARGRASVGHRSAASFGFDDAAYVSHAG